MTQRSGWFNKTNAGDAIAHGAQIDALLVSAMNRNPLEANSKARGHLPLTGASATTDPLAVTESTIPAMTVQVNVGAALLDGHWYHSDAAETLVIANNSTGSTRYDSVVLQFIAATPSIRLVVKTGTASPPTLTDTLAYGLTAAVTGTLEWEIARITVANAAASIVNANINNNYNVPLQSSAYQVKTTASSNAPSTFTSLWGSLQQRKASPLLVVVYTDLSAMFFSNDQGTTWYEIPALAGMISSQQTGVSGTWSAVATEQTLLTTNMTTRGNRKILILARIIQSAGHSITFRLKYNGTTLTTLAQVGSLQFIAGIVTAPITSIAACTLTIQDSLSTSQSYSNGMIFAMEL